MGELPASLVDGLLPPEISRVETWWAGLSEGSRNELTSLWDERIDLKWFDTTDGDAVPSIIGGRFVPRDDMAGWDEWQTEMFDHLMCHPEGWEVLTFRTFRICTAHPVGREVFATGHIPADFKCPLANGECPVHKLIDWASDVKAWVNRHYSSSCTDT